MRRVFQMLVPTTLFALAIVVRPACAGEGSGGQPSMPTGCAPIVAVLEQGGGALSAEEVARKTSTDVETVRSCTDVWQRTQKAPAPPKGVRATDQPVPAGCAQVVAVLEQGGGELSPDEVAKKTNTDVETVRNCTDLWRRSMKGGAHQ